MKKNFVICILCLSIFVVSCGDEPTEPTLTTAYVSGLTIDDAGYGYVTSIDAVITANTGALSITALEVNKDATRSQVGLSIAALLNQVTVGCAYEVIVGTSSDSDTTEQAETVATTDSIYVALVITADYAGSVDEFGYTEILAASTLTTVTVITSTEVATELNTSLLSGSVDLKVGTDSDGDVNSTIDSSGIASINLSDLTTTLTYGDIVSEIEAIEVSNTSYFSAYEVITVTIDGVLVSDLTSTTFTDVSLAVGTAIFYVKLQAESGYALDPSIASTPIVLLITDTSS